VSIFRRRRPTADATSADATPAAATPADASPADAAAADAGPAGAPGTGDGGASGARGGEAAPTGTDVSERGPTDRSEGPFDVAEAGDTSGHLDLGSLLVTGVEGMELRLEVDQDQQSVIAATAVLGDSALQVQAFAAPRTAGLWDDIRAEIAEAIVAQGGTAETAPGPHGPELRTRMPSAGPDGRTVFAPARFVGVDGPRWFLRGVLSGRAAIEDDAAEPLLGIFRSTVVVRGSDPMAPRELLPLTLPREVEPAAPADEDEEPAGAALDPFTRGPEITEVR
jgi:hypothetical protein